MGRKAGGSHSYLLVLGILWEAVGILLDFVPNPHGDLIRVLGICVVQDDHQVFIL